MKPGLGVESQKLGLRSPKTSKNHLYLMGTIFYILYGFGLFWGTPKKNEKNSDSLVNHDSPIRTAINSDIPQFQTHAQTHNSMGRDRTWKRAPEVIQACLKQVPPIPMDN